MSVDFFYKNSYVGLVRYLLLLILTSFMWSAQSYAHFSFEESASLSAQDSADCEHSHQQNSDSHSDAEEDCHSVGHCHNALCHALVPFPLAVSLHTRQESLLSGLAAQGHPTDFLNEILRPPTHV